MMAFRNVSQADLPADVVLRHGRGRNKVMNVPSDQLVRNLPFFGGHSSICDRLRLTIGLLPAGGASRLAVCHQFDLARFEPVMFRCPRYCSAHQPAVRAVGGSGLNRE
jgi:hypothetical protein